MAQPLLPELAAGMVAAEAGAEDGDDEFVELAVADAWTKAKTVEVADAGGA